jgi:hypothetical protein
MSEQKKAQAQAQAQARAQVWTQVRTKAKAEIQTQVRAKAEAEIQAQMRAKAEADARIHAWAQAQARAKAEADARAQAEIEARARAWAIAKAEAEAQAREEARAKAEARARAQAEAQARAEARAKAQAEAQARAEARAKAQAEAQARAEARAKAEAEARAKAEAEARAQAKAEAEARARARAEAEARARAQAEARARAQAEAQARAQAEAQARSEARARAKAEAEARAKAEAEARVQAEIEARARAWALAKVEAEARAQAEAEAREKAEAQAKAEAEAKIKEDARIQREKQAQMFSQNQNRIQFEHKIQNRVIIPKNNIIDLHNNINSNITCNKTIINVLDNSNGFGDFLRGSILLAQYAKYYNINFKVDVSRHNISKFLDNEQEILSTTNKINFVCFSSKGDNDNHMNLYSIIEEFINSNEENIYITTNLYYNINLISQDIKDCINSFLIFKQKYYDIANELFNLKKYNVLHIRCLDEHFNTDFEDNYLLTEIIKLQLTPNTIIMTNNYTLKRQINKLFGFYFIDKNVYHTAKLNNYTELESTIIEYIILSKSSHTYCFSYYHHGSGFSEQCSVLNNIPYSVIFLPSKNFNTNNIKLLINYYNNIVDHNFITNFEINKEKVNDDTNYNNITFLTLTNSGYIDYTLNCLQSLKNINMKKQLKVYCIGKEGYTILNNNNVTCELIDNEEEELNVFQKFRTQKWSNVVFYKFEIIYNNLLNNEYVCITDGDIVYENNQIFDYLLSHIEDNDLLIQSEGIDVVDLCSGFMFIKSNENTISLFNPKNVERYKNKEGWGDQIYINSIKYKLKYKKLPLKLFPTGNYYYQYNKNIQPYLIHFNWVIGHEKKNKMMYYNKWYVSKKVKICQYGTDGFGHQLEGILRLLSLSINNKAEYYHNYDKTYIFEHSNFEINTLKQYLTEAINIILKEEQKEETTLNLILREQRTFDEILKNDENVENTIYYYDGVCSNIPGKLPPNFEANTEIEKSLPKLREAFVEKNKYLPEKSYDNTFINVCCHIRLGDAVGQRILDNENLFKVIKEFQKYNKYRIIIHTDGDVNNLQCDNTTIYDSKTDVLQVLSDFIYADILIMNFSSLSIVAHLLGDNKQNVICPTNAGPTFKHRCLNKCITVDEILNNLI